MTHPLRLLVLVVATALSTGCSNFRANDEGVTLRRMSAPLRWSPYDGPALPSPRQFPSVTVVPDGAILFGGIGPGGPIGEGWRWDGRRWQALSADGAPRGRSAHAAIWTGAQLCIWGGEARGGCFDDGACWDPLGDRWQPLGTDGPLTPRSAMASAFTGREWILWGGRDADGNDLADGARYDPRTQRWGALPDGGPRARHRAFTAVSPDGFRVLIWGGAGEALALGAEDAFILDLQASRWIQVALDGAPPARTAPVAVEVPAGLVAVSGDQVVIFEWGTGRWRALDPFPLPGRWGMTIAAVPAGVIVWGGRDETGVRDDGAALDLATGRWTVLATDGAPAGRTDAVPIPDAGQLLLLWGAGVEGLRADGFRLR